MVNIRNIPIIGDDIYQTGQVIEILNQPCTPIPTIMVTAFFANLPMLVWSLVKPTPEDYLTNRLGRPHKRRRRHKLTIKDFDVKPPTGKKTMAHVEFSGIKMLERAGWYLLVIDATTDFAVNWTSMAYQYSGCDDPLSGYASTQRTGTQNVFNIAPGTTFLNGNQLAETSGYSANGTTVTKVHAGAHWASATTNIQADPAFPNARLLSLDLVQGPGEGDVIYPAEKYVTQPDGSNDFVAVNRNYNVLAPGTSYRMRARSEGGNLFSRGFNMQISGFNNPLKPDP